MKDKYRKFVEYLKDKGFFYALWRGISYFIFLVRKKIFGIEAKEIEQGIVISKGRLKIVFRDSWVKIYWDKAEITQRTGLNSAVNTLGIWTDSSRAKWELVAKDDDYAEFKVTFHDLPVVQTWQMRINSENDISWTVDMCLEESLYINEYKVICLMSPFYKNWLNGYEEGSFPQVRCWQDMPLFDKKSRLVGMRFPVAKASIASFVLEFSQSDSGRTLPVIQNSSKEINGHIVGVSTTYEEEKLCCKAGDYRFFSGRLKFFSDERDLDREIEYLRKASYEKEKKRTVLKRQPKVLLVNLPWNIEGKWGVRAGSRWPHMKDESEGNYLPFPFFLAYASALLKNNSIETDIIDAIAEKIPEDEFIEKLLKSDFDVLVVETSVPSFYYDMRLLRRIASRLGVFIVLCGPHSEIYKPLFLEKNSFVDFVLFGEYENTLLELVKAISSGKKDFAHISGLIWRGKDNQPVKNQARQPEDINLFPWPYRDGLPMNKYWDLPGNIPYPSAQMVASRGCPFCCNFCLWPQILFPGGTYRVRAVKDCVDEMEYLVKQKEFKSVYFDDDTFNVGKPRMLEFCDEIIKRGLNHIPWAIMAKADLMDEEILDKMKAAGLYAVKYGVESASQRLVDKCGKHLDLDKTEQMIEYTKKLGINVHLTFSFGLHGETKQTIKQTIDYALKLDPQSVQFSIITPFPGTSLFEELDKQGRILTKDWSLYDGHYSCVFQPENLSPQDLEEAKQYAYRIWADYQRKKRGLSGDLRIFLSCCRKAGLASAIKKALGYLVYLVFRRGKFVRMR